MKPSEISEALGPMASNDPSQSGMPSNALVPYTSLAKGDKFKLPNDPDNSVLMKISDQNYKVISSETSDTKNMTFSMANARGGKTQKVYLVK